MARKRMIDPSWLESQSLGKCSRTGRLLFLGLITLADDEGRLRGDPVFLRNTIFPYDDDLETADIIAGLDALQDFGCIRFYSVDGLNFIFLPKWRDYQKIDRPTGSKLPECPNNWVKKSLAKDSSINRRGLVANGINRIEVKGINRTTAPEEKIEPKVSFSTEMQEENSGPPPEDPAPEKAIVKKSTKPEDPDRDLKKAIEDSFIAVSGDFHNYAMQRESIKRIIKYGRQDMKDSPDRVNDYIRVILEKFKELTDPEKRVKFFSGIEFTPAKLVGLWDGVKKALQGDFEKRLTPEDEAYIDGVMERGKNVRLKTR